MVNSQGYPVLDDTNKPIIIDSGVQDISIGEDGQISADDRKLGKLKIVKFGDIQTLERQGATMFKTDVAPQPATDIQILQGHLEGSNVEPILEITRFMSATGAYQSAKKIIDDEHDRMRRAIQTLASKAE